MDHEIDKEMWGSIGINVVIFILGLFLMSLVVKHVVIGPIEYLRQMIEGISTDANLTRRIDVKSEDEIGKVSTAFNLMLEMFQEEYIVLKKQLMIIKFSYLGEEIQLMICLVLNSEVTTE